MKRIFFTALLILLALPILALEITKDNKGYYYRQQTYQFPQKLKKSIPTPLTLFESDVDIQAPSCQNPGFAFEFTGFITNYQQVVDHLDENIRGVLQGIGLLGLETLFPEMATVFKHLEDMSWHKIKLDNFNCQGAMDTVRESGVLPSQRPYASCIDDQMKNNNKSREDAETACSDTLTKIHDFLGDKNDGVDSFDLIDRSISYYKKLRNDTNDTSIPKDKQLDKLQEILGGINISSKGKSVKRGVSFKSYLIDVRSAIELAVTELVDECRNDFDPKDKDPSCKVANDRLDFFKKELTIVLPRTDSKTYFISLSTIHRLARMPKSLSGNAIDYFAYHAMVMRGRFLVSTWKNIVATAMKEDGAVEHEKTYQAYIDEMNSQLEELQKENSSRMALLSFEEKIFKLDQEAEHIMRSGR